jgi:hypothetical protein
MHVGGLIHAARCHHPADNGENDEEACRRHGEPKLV